MNTTEIQVPAWEKIDARQLRVDFLHFPRLFRPRHFEWDLDQGFRLEVLSPRHFWLAVPQTRHGDHPMDVSGAAPEEQDFLLFVERQGGGRFPDWPRSRLGPHTIGVILSQEGVAAKVPPDWPNLVIWVRQPMPAGTRWTGNDFFTPEQILYQWGRVGRRVRRRTRWRKWLPW